MNTRHRRTRRLTLAATAAVVAILVSAAMSAPARAAGWSAPVKIDAAATQQAPITSVSCVAGGFCAAIDSAGYVIFDQGGTWSAPARFESGNPLTSISCASSTFCVAVWASGGAPGGAYMWNGSTWTSVSFPGDAESVSCASSQLCVATGVGTFNPDNTGDPNNAEVYENGQWTAETIDSGNTIGPVSCTENPSPFCAVVDQQNGALEYTPTGGWTSTQTAIDTTGGTLESMSCPSATLCFTDDGQTGAVFDWLGNGWESDPGVTAYDTSCGSVNFCFAYSGYSTMIQWNGSSWSRAPAPADGGGLSCVASGACVAVSEVGDASVYPATGSGFGGSSSSGGGSSGGGTTSGGSNATTVKAASIGAAKGKVEVTLSCPAGRSCAAVSVKVTVKVGRHLVTIASRTVKVAGGRKEKLTLTLDAAGRSLTRHGRKVAATVTVTSGTHLLRRGTVRV